MLRGPVKLTVGPEEAWIPESWLRASGVDAVGHPVGSAIWRRGVKGAPRAGVHVWANLWPNWRVNVDEPRAGVGGGEVHSATVDPCGGDTGESPPDVAIDASTPVSGASAATGGAAAWCEPALDRTVAEEHGAGQSEAFHVLFEHPRPEEGQSGRRRDGGRAVAMEHSVHSHSHFRGGSCGVCIVRVETSYLDPVLAKDFTIFDIWEG